ncbi:hypothetical protein K1T71_006916 [Dendrolimus kikuchii]|uniref:Uncharacterized protein n=1 Tax=Dendrolimus kikuchii TaxID=765133 RepID=A0ACC1D048_9NEOP|nr:hypothetical protein K1T71_006916 [Dendrolimus kikuchii]
MAKCTACGKFLSPVGAATCNNCPLMFHKGCVALPDTATVSKTWNCPECKKKIRKGDNSATPIKSICGNDSPPGSTCSAPGISFSTTLVTPSGDDDDESELRMMRREIAEYMSELRREMADLRLTIGGIGQRLDGIENRLDVLEQRELTTQSKDAVELDNSISQLKQELNERDQESLLSDVDIGCFPEVAGENVYHTVTVLAAKLGMKIEEQDIVFAERVGSGGVVRGETGERCRRIVVRLVRRNMRDDLLRAARVRRNLNTSDMGLGGLQHRIYVNERLTRSNRQLFYRVREECRKKNWRYSWTKRGRIFARQSDGKQAYLIRSDADLSRVFELGKV